MTKPNHPYKSLEGQPVWSVLEQAIRDLVDNQDILEQTSRAHIVGYVAKRLVESGVVPRKPQTRVQRRRSIPLPPTPRMVARANPPHRLAV